MSLTAAIAKDSAGSRRFRRFAPAMVLIGIAMLILGPNLVA